MYKNPTQSAQPAEATPSTLSSQIIPPESLLGRCLGLPMPSTSDFDSPFRSEERKLKFREFRKEYERIVDADETLRRYEVYNLISPTLYGMWLYQIPSEVRNVLCGFDGLINLPRLFVVWWVIRNDIEPLSYPLPAPLRHFPRIPSLVQGSEYRLPDSLFDETDKETPLGHAVSQAWDHVSEDDRQLMLFFWAAMRDVEGKKIIGHQNTPPSRVFAQEVLNNDLTGEVDVLLPRASHLLSITKGFTESHGDIVEQDKSAV